MRFWSFTADVITSAVKVNIGNALHLSGKFNAGRISSGGGFQVFRGAKFSEHPPLNAALLCPGSYAARLVALAIRIALYSNVVLLVSAQLLRLFPHHAATCRWFQICKQRRQLYIYFL